MPAVVLVGLVGIFLAFCLAYALLVGYQSTIGALLRALNSLAYNIKIPVVNYHPFHWLGDGLLSLDSTINNALGNLVTGTHHAWSAVMNQVGLLLHETTDALADLAEATQRALGHLPRAITQTIVPAWVYPLRSTVHFLQRLLGRLEAKVAALPRLVTHTVTHEATKVITHVVKIVKVETRTVIHAIPALHAPSIPRLPALERTVHGIDETLKDALRKVSPFALAAVIAGTVLAKIGLSWTRCSNVNRAGKAVCGMDRNILEGLLAGLLALFGTFSLVEFSKFLIPVVGEIAGDTTKFWRADVAGQTADRAIGSPSLNAR